jgi:hypothetical protein
VPKTISLQNAADPQPSSIDKTLIDLLRRGSIGTLWMKLPPSLSYASTQLFPYRAIAVSLNCEFIFY